MRRKIKVLISFLTLFLAINQTFATVAQSFETPVQVTEIKDLGLSEADETKSIIEIRWEINPMLHPNHSGFNVTLEIRYADNAVLIFDEQAEYTARSARLEVPTLHIFRGKKPAIIKEIKAFVITETNLRNR